jgi:hypothetical protein
MGNTSLGLSMINEWCIPSVGNVSRKRDGRKIGIVVGEYQLGYEFYELRVDYERPTSFLDY